MSRLRKNLMTLKCDKPSLLHDCSVRYVTWLLTKLIFHEGCTRGRPRRPPSRRSLPHDALKVEIHDMAQFAHLFLTYVVVFWTMWCGRHQHTVLDRRYVQ